MLWMCRQLNIELTRAASASLSTLWRRVKLTCHYKRGFTLSHRLKQSTWLRGSRYGGCWSWVALRSASCDSGSAATEAADYELHYALLVVTPDRPLTMSCTTLCQLRLRIGCWLWVALRSASCDSGSAAKEAADYELHYALPVATPDRPLRRLLTMSCTMLCQLRLRIGRYGGCWLWVALRSASCDSESTVTEAADYELHYALLVVADRNDDHDTTALHIQCWNDKTKPLNQTVHETKTSLEKCKTVKVWKK